MVNVTRWKILWGGIWIAFLFGHCGHIVDSQPETEISLPKIDIRIDSESLTTLVNTNYTDYSPRVKATLGGRTYNSRIENQGYGSRRYVKKSYKLKFEERELYESRQGRLIITAQFLDPSFLRYRLSLKLFEEAGLPVLNTDFAGLYMNDVFYGIYLTVEPVDEYFLINRNIPPGNLYKAIDGNARFSLKSGYQVELGFEKKINEDGNSNDLVNLLYVLDTVPDSLLNAALRPILDIENALDYLAVSVLTCNWDGFFHNFYLFHNPETGRFMFIPYDLDMTFGLGAPASSMHVNGHCHKGANDLFERLLSYPPYRQYYRNRLETLLASSFSVEHLSPIMEDIYQRLIDDYAKDPVLGRVGYNLAREINGLKDFIETRAAFVRAELKDF